MEISERIRKQENLHIVFWLIKDSCWMLGIKWLGAAMVVPALAIALWIVYNTRHSLEVFINLAILFWIIANSYWMLVEFYNNDEQRHYAAIPFALGFVFVGIYYYRTAASRNKAA